MGRKYNLEAFSQNLLKIDEHNQRSNFGYKLGINRLSGLSHEEILEALNINTNY